MDVTEIVRSDDPDVLYTKTRLANNVCTDCNESVDYQGRHYHPRKRRKTPK